MAGQRICCQQNSARCPGGFFIGPQQIFDQLVASPVGTVAGTPLVQPAVNLHRPGVIAGGQQRHHQFTGFCDGDPGLLFFATTAELILDKFIPA